MIRDYPIAIGLGFVLGMIVWFFVLLIAYLPGFRPSPFGWPLIPFCVVWLLATVAMLLYDQTAGGV